MARLAAGIDRLVVGIARHWLALFNLVVGLFVVLPFLAPVLMNAGLTTPARLIYTIYSPTCHQLPERSWFLFGPQAVYSVAELEALGALPGGITEFQRLTLRFIGTTETGFKVAICERDTAIYGAILLAGLVFGIARGGRSTTRRMRKLPLWTFAIFVMPAAVDGLSQLAGLRESNWLLRLLTGAIFGIGSVFMAYPWVDESMRSLTLPPDHATSGRIGQNDSSGL